MKTNLLKVAINLCDVQIQLTSAKKITGGSDLSVSIDASIANSVAFAEKIQRLLNKYPLQYGDIWKIVKDNKPNIKQTKFNDVIKELGIKGNSTYSHSFLYPKQPDEYENSGKVSGTHCCLYNDDTVRLILENIEE